MIDINHSLNQPQVPACQVNVVWIQHGLYFHLALSRLLDKCTFFWFWSLWTLKWKRDMEVLNLCERYFFIFFSFHYFVRGPPSVSFLKTDWWFASFLWILRLFLIISLLEKHVGVQIYLIIFNFWFFTFHRTPLESELCLNSFLHETTYVQLRNI